MPYYLNKKFTKHENFVALTPIDTRIENDISPQNDAQPGTIK